MLATATGQPIVESTPASRRKKAKPKATSPPPLTPEEEFKLKLQKARVQYEKESRFLAEEEESAKVKADDERAQTMLDLLSTASPAKASFVRRDADEREETAIKAPLGHDTATTSPASAPAEAADPTHLDSQPSAPQLLPPRTPPRATTARSTATPSSSYWTPIRTPKSPSAAVTERIILTASRLKHIDVSEVESRSSTHRARSMKTPTVYGDAMRKLRHVDPSSPFSEMPGVSGVSDLGRPRALATSASAPMAHGLAPQASGADPCTAIRQLLFRHAAASVVPPAVHREILSRREVSDALSSKFRLSSQLVVVRFTQWRPLLFLPPALCRLPAGKVSVTARALHLSASPSHADAHAHASPSRRRRPTPRRLPAHAPLLQPHLLSPAA